MESIQSLLEISRTVIPKKNKMENVAGYFRVAFDRYATRLKINVVNNYDNIV